REQRDREHACGLRERDGREDLPLLAEDRLIEIDLLVDRHQSVTGSWRSAAPTAGRQRRCSSGDKLVSPSSTFLSSTSRTASPSSCASCAWSSVASPLV